jgi:hypothetical protein
VTKKHWLAVSLASLLACAAICFADSPISSLPTVTTGTASDEIPVNQAGVTKKLTVQKLDEFLGVTTHKSDATIHRSINDAATSTTGLWSSDKINTALGTKAASTHAHSASDVTSGTLGVARGGTGLSTMAANKIVYTSALDTFAPLTLDGTLAITSGVLGVQDNTSVQKYQIQKAGTAIGARRAINFIDGTTTNVTVADNVGQDRVDVTITQTGAAWPKGYWQGKPVEYVSASTVQIPTGFKARSSDDTINMEAASNLTCALTVSGAGGLDTGSEAANTTYYLYMIQNPTGPTNSCLLSTTNESNTGSITLPSGYTKKRQLPIAIRNDGSSNIIPFFVGNGWPNRPKVIYRVTHAGGGQTVGATNVLDGGTSSTYATVSAGNFVPPISKMGVFRVQNAQTSAPVDNWVRTQGASADFLQVYIDGNRFGGETLEIETNSTQQIEYKTTGTLDIDVWGYVVTEVQ